MVRERPGTRDEKGGPAQGFRQFHGDEPQIEALLIGMARHAAKAFGKGLGVTVGTAWRDFGAAPDGVLRGISPFDFGVGAQLGFLFTLRSALSGESPAIGGTPPNSSLGAILVDDG